MKNVLLLHIGMPKTGTTVIQDFLGTNSEKVEPYGWYYPNFKVMFPEMKAHWSGKYKNGDFLYEGWRNINIHSENWEMLWEFLLKKLKCSNVILSAEELFEWDTNYIIREIKNKYDNVKLLVYLRRQDEYIESRWNQEVKSEELCLETKFDDYVSKLPDEYSHIYEGLFYWNKLEQLARIVGRDNIIVRVYEKEQFIGTRKNIVSDFLYAIGITDDIQSGEKEKKLNVRLNAKTLEIKRIFNTFLRNKGPKEKRYYSNLFRQLSLVSDDGKKNSMGYFTNDKRVEFFMQFEKQNELVAREYLHRDDGTLFYENRIDCPQEIKYVTESEEEIIKAFAYIIVEQATKMGAQIKQLEIQSRMLVQNLILIQKGERKLAYFGAGKRCSEMLENYQLPVEYIFDNDLNKRGTQISDISIGFPSDVQNLKDYFILVTCIETHDIEQQLNSYGLQKEIDYIFLKQLI